MASDTHYYVPIKVAGDDRVGFTRVLIADMNERQQQFRKDLDALRVECKWAEGHLKMDPEFHTRSAALVETYFKE